MRDGGVGRVAVLVVEDADSAFKVGAASAAEPDDGVKPASSPTTSPSSEIWVGSSPFALVNRPRRLTAPLSGADGSGSGSPACAPRLGLRPALPHRLQGGLSWQFKLLLGGVRGAPRAQGNPHELEQWRERPRPRLSQPRVLCPCGWRWAAAGQQFSSMQGKKLLASGSNNSDKQGEKTKHRAGKPGKSKNKEQKRVVKEIKGHTVLTGATAASRRVRCFFRRGAQS